ncbi:neck protein [Vibrio phage nt-1]|uniref:Neck protein n=1 Tax=Vibrio phage nt-1 TaxID=115992 RepID=R9TG12_9CAUD|nr:head-tail adaptor Ad2 [Vibrio phage nt-1]AGN30023.1 neck protein [Vibrio phage nt-1]
MQAYNATSPREMKDLILRRLGAPIVNVEVSEDQIYDCISRALELYIEYHPDGVNKTYSIISLSAEQAQTGIVNLDIPATAITKIVRAGSSFFTMDGNATYSWFTDFLQGLTGGGKGSCNTYHGMLAGGGLSDYWSLMSYKNTLMDILSPEHDYWYNGVNKQLRINANLSEGEIVVVEAYVPSALLVSESATGIIGNKAATIGSYEDVTLQESWDDPYSILRQNNIIGNPNQFAEQNAYSVRWVKDMATAMVKQVNGTILKKHQGLQLPGGITVDGKEIYDEATQEMERLREELMTLTVPLGVYMG